ncbi:hypothetical protein [Gaoshiqia sp. Z1-71]|uniref:hypothetical protein n=1 Tax=Gaoshiqia hydrogeniformans TaxID=3290090 RepID=UPI003BF7A290
MANIRNLKKDIDYLVEQVLLDCFRYINEFEGADQEGAYEIVADVLSLHNDLRNRANHPDGKDNKTLVREHYKTIGKDLIAGCDKAYDQLNKLIGPAK